MHTFQEKNFQPWCRAAAQDVGAVAAARGAPAARPRAQCLNWQHFLNVGRYFCGAASARFPTGAPTQWDVRNAPSGTLGVVWRAHYGIPGRKSSVNLP